ncbi:alpha carbonic anhydrase [Gamsiella multidivaricata]|uniref:alpha carbonic anhydrase n=1 Tax=Gamsiella multidivaricata TaxID=101098 RepID=UPI00221F2332|nr:alpha carbonic anhydrase [Gamsiella multidivaricata]KAG0361201.1 hypothetical protein BGZ54_009188 [Gamsiella multidivaricata]KAI7821754.1 alpha carbonic anhydrase [Gamsiella multidivaricata]
MKLALNLALAVAALISTSFVAADQTSTHHAGHKRAAPGAHWTYGQDNAGPQHWGALDPLYGTCGTGKEQSPIDVAIGAPFVALQKKPFSALNYSPLRNVLCGYDSHTVKCEWNSTVTAPNKNSIVIKDKTYNLLQFHFHSPSEHRVNNHFADAELHLVHQAEDKSLAVVGVLLEVQANSNPFFEWVVKLDKKVDQLEHGHGFLVKDPVSGEPVPGEEQVKYKIDKVDFSPLLKATGKFTPRWEYEGSLTTPPCTEGVAWNVVRTSVGLGLKQFDALVDLESYNSRFIQDRPTKEGN